MPNLLNWVALLALVGTVLRSVPAVHAVAGRQWFVMNYMASNWWLDYTGAGFVRRALPGQVLAWLVGGVPTAWEVTAACLVMTVAALVALGALTWTLARRAPLHLRLPVAALVAASPFTFGQTIRDIGRYDVIGVVAVAAVVAVAGHRRATLVVAGVAVLVAGLSEEYLAAYVAPVALIAVAIGRSGWQRLAVPAAVVAPGLLATAVSCINQASVADLQATEAAAHAARPDIIPGSPTAIAALWQSPELPLHHLTTMDWWVVPVATLVYGGCFAVAVALLWHFLGRPAGIVWYAGLFALATVILSVVATDYQRWWATAFVAAVGALALLSYDPQGRRSADVPVSARLAAVVAVVLLVGVAGQMGPVAAGQLEGREDANIGISLPPTS